MSFSTPAPRFDDEMFDLRLPHYERERARQFWTPVAVAERAAAAFSACGVREVIGVNYSCTLATTTFAEPEQVDGAPRRPRGGPGGWGERSQSHG